MTAYSLISRDDGSRLVLRYGQQSASRWTVALADAGIGVGGGGGGRGSLSLPLPSTSSFVNSERYCTASFFKKKPKPKQTNQNKCLPDSLVDSLWSLVWSKCQRIFGESQKESVRRASLFLRSLAVNEMVPPLLLPLHFKSRIFFII